MRRGDVVLVAIETYLATNGKAPLSLDDLRQVIPRSTVGMREWRLRSQGTGFTLTVAGSPSGYPTLTYDSAVGRRTQDN